MSIPFESSFSNKTNAFILGIKINLDWKNWICSNVLTWSFFTWPDIAYKKCGSLNRENCTLTQDMWAAVHVHKVVSTHSIAQYVCHWISYRLLQSVTAECRLNRGVRHKKERHLCSWNAKWTETTAIFLLGTRVCTAGALHLPCPLQNAGIE